MSFLGLGAAAQGRSRSRSRSRVRTKDDNHSQPQYQMSGALPHDAEYSTVQPGVGIPGVQYAKPWTANYADNSGAQVTPQYAETPSGGYQYATTPANIQYSAKPVIHPSRIAPIETSEETEKEKHMKQNADAAVYNQYQESKQAQQMREQYSTMTIEPGGKSSKKKKKHGEVETLPYPTGGIYDQMPPPPRPNGLPFGGMPPLPPPPGHGIGHPGPYHDGSRGPPYEKIGRYAVATPSGYPVAVPSHYPVEAHEERPHLAQRDSSFDHDVHIQDVAPRGVSPTRSKSKTKSSSHRLSTSGPRPDLRAPSPSGRSHSDLLSVAGSGRPRGMSGSNLPPPSPMLEAYRGTWQSMPGMPSPMIRGRDGAYDDFNDEEFEPLDQQDSRKSRPKLKEVKTKSGSGSLLTIQKVGGRSSSRQRSVSRARSKSPKKKTVSMYESEQDAKHISSELIRSKPDFRVLTDVLPGLSHDQIIELHTAYKNVAKIQGKGINIAKHIKLKVTGQLRTIAYVTALGRWESEGYWANYWYQSAVSKRELLIESLMGRTNFEMQMIKENFKDKRYSDSLVRCMDKELRVDKFRTAVMQALEANRQEENEQFPAEYVEKDVDTWIRALKGRSGGETAMLEICVTRSDAHLKKCLRMYEREKGGNFAKQALARSENLVGEVIAHILNGVINRPARDAMLLHHALLDLKPRSKDRRDSSSSSDDRSEHPRSSSSKMLKNPLGSESREAREKAKRKETEKAKEREDRKNRYELLISRVVRYHWDKVHLRKIIEEYRRQFDAYVEDDVEDWLKEGEFREFVLALLEGK